MKPKTNQKGEAATPNNSRQASSLWVTVRKAVKTQFIPLASLVKENVRNWRNLFN